MAQFTYKAVSSQGKTVDGLIAADRLELASRELKAQGLTLLSLQPASARDAASATALGSGSAKREDILAMTREMGVLLRAGLPIDRALKVMIDMAAHDRLRSLLEDLLASVKSGKGLSEALAAYPREFDSFYVNMVRSGEASGHLAEVLTRLSDYLTNAKAVRSSIVSAITYPVILVVVAVLSVGAMLGFVVPQFESLFNDMGDALPLMTRAVIGMGDWMKSYAWIVVIVVLALGWVIRNWFRSEDGRRTFDTRLLSIPVLGAVVYKYEVSKFARTVGTLLGNGVSLLQAISIAVDTVNNIRLREALGFLEPAVKRGQRVSVALEEAGEFSPLMIQMARVGEESGSLDQMMTELAQVYDEEVQAGVKRGLSLLEPVLILSMAAMIAVIIIAILMGIMSVNNLAM